MVDPDAVSATAFADQEKRLVAYLGSDSKTAEEIITAPVFKQFSKRLGEEAAEAFIRRHVGAE